MTEEQVEQLSPKGFEYTEMRGWNVKNQIVTISCTVALAVTILTAYFGLKNDGQLTDLRLKVVEAQIQVIDQQLKDLQHNQDIKR